MKYSPAVVVACLGGAALAAVETSHPIPHPNEHHLPESHLSESHVPQHATELNAKPKLSHPHSLAKNAGKMLTAASTFAKYASGNANTYDNSENPAETGVYRRTPFSLPHIPLPHHIPKPHVQKVASKGKEFAKTAIEAGGGAQNVAQNLGTVVNYLSTSSQSAPMYRRDTGVRGSGRRRGGKGEGKKRLPKENDAEKVQNTPEVPPTVDARDVAENDELFGRGFIGNIKANYHDRKAKDDAKKAAKETAKAAEETALSGIDSGSTSSSDPAVSRELNEELEARKFEYGDILDSRGFIDNIKANYHNRKAKDETKKAAMETAKAAKEAAYASINAGTSTPTVDPSAAGVPTANRREFGDELVTRGLFDDDIEARSLWAKVRHGAGALKDAVLGKKPGATASTTPPPAGTDPSMGMDGGDPNAVANREFIDGDALILRDLYDLADELDTREFSEDELEARFFRHLRKGLATAIGKRPVNTQPSGTDPSTGADPDVATRDIVDFSDELEAREFLDEDDLYLRDVEDYLDSREFDEEFELFERDIPKEFDARDFADDVDARDFEIDELD